MTISARADFVGRRRLERPLPSPGGDRGVALEERRIPDQQHRTAWPRSANRRAATKPSPPLLPGPATTTTRWPSSAAARPQPRGRRFPSRRCRSPRRRSPDDPPRPSPRWSTVRAWELDCPGRDSTGAPRPGNKPRQAGLATVVPAAGKACAGCLIAGRREMGAHPGPPDPGLSRLHAITLFPISRLGTDPSYPKSGSPGETGWAGRTKDLE